MGGGGSKRRRAEAEARLREAAEQAKRQAEEEGRRTMERCIQSLQKELQDSKALMSQDKEMVKDMMNKFIAGQADMKQQYQGMLREMVQKDAMYVQERTNAEQRHNQQMVAMKEEREHLREGHERTVGALRQDMKQERERLQREQEAQLNAVREDMREDRERNQQEKAQILTSMKEEKEVMLKRHDEQIDVLKSEMKEERGMMQKHLDDRVTAMKEEKEHLEKQHESHIQTLQTTMKEEKEIIEKHLEERVESMKDERERLEHNYTGQIQSLKEDSEKTKKEQQEQMQTMKKEMTEDKQKIQESYETRLQTEKQEYKEEKERINQDHSRQMLEVKEEMKEDKERMAQGYERHLQNVREDRKEEREVMERNQDRLMRLMENRDKQFENMIAYQQRTMDYLIEGQLPSMIMYQQRTMNMLLSGQLPQPRSYGFGRLQSSDVQFEEDYQQTPMMVEGRMAPAINYEPDAYGNLIPRHHQMSDRMLYPPEHYQGDPRHRPASGGRMDPRMQRPQMRYHEPQSPLTEGHNQTSNLDEADAVEEENRRRQGLSQSETVQASGRGQHMLPPRPSATNQPMYETRRGQDIERDLTINGVNHTGAGATRQEAADTQQFPPQGAGPAMFSSSRDTLCENGPARPEGRGDREAEFATSETSSVARAPFPGRRSFEQPTRFPQREYDHGNVRRAFTQPGQTDRMYDPREREFDPRDFSHGQPAPGMTAPRNPHASQRFEGMPGRYREGQPELSRPSLGREADMAHFGQQDPGLPMRFSGSADDENWYGRRPMSGNQRNRHPMFDSDMGDFGSELPYRGSRNVPRATDPQMTGFGGSMQRQMGESSALRHQLGEGSGYRQPSNDNQRPTSLTNGVCNHESPGNERASQDQAYGTLPSPASPLAHGGTQESGRLETDSNYPDDDGESLSFEVLNISTSYSSTNASEDCEQGAAAFTETEAQQASVPVGAQ